MRSVGSKLTPPYRSPIGCVHVPVSHPELSPGPEACTQLASPPIDPHEAAHVFGVDAAAARLLALHQQLRAALVEVRGAFVHVGRASAALRIAACGFSTW